MGEKGTIVTTRQDATVADLLDQLDQEPWHPTSSSGEPDEAPGREPVDTTVSRVSIDEASAPVRYADPIMMGIPPTTTTYVLQQRVWKWNGPKWFVVANAHRYGDLPRGKLRWLQIDTYKVENGALYTGKDGVRYLVPAGTFTHYIVRGPVHRGQYRSYSSALGQQVTFDPNVT